jgi:hypothetical protein
MLSTSTLFDVRGCLDPSEGRASPFNLNCASAPLIIACRCNGESLKNFSVKAKSVRSLETTLAGLRRDLRYM